jgi:hypothetical protein
MGETVSGLKSGAVLQSETGFDPVEMKLCRRLHPFEAQQIALNRWKASRILSWAAFRLARSVFMAATSARIAFRTSYISSFAIGHYPL